MMEYQCSDAMLMELLKEHKSITGFLDAIFGFLCRNTDFYHEQTDEDIENIGFPKGVREQLVYESMQRCNPNCQLNATSSSNIIIVADDEYAPPAIDEVEIETMGEVDLVEQTIVPNESIKQQQQIETMGEVDLVKQTIVPNESIKQQQHIEFVPSDYTNGALYENYCWSQTLKDVELLVNLPPHLSHPRQLCIEILPDSITVRSRQQEDCIIFAGKLCNKYKYNDVVWTITDCKLQINFDKCKEMWWDKLLNTENCIDRKKIDCERFIDELPEESQAAIHKLRVQQMTEDNKIQLKNTHDIEMMEKLRKAWDAEDSPFRGQPFDVTFESN